MSNGSHECDQARDTGETAKERFLYLTSHLFGWNECECLLDNKGGEIPASEVTVDEAISLIEEGGYTPCPF